MRRSSFRICTGTGLVALVRNAAGSQSPLANDSLSFVGRALARQRRSHDFLDRFFARAAQATAQGHPRIKCGHLTSSHPGFTRPRKIAGRHGQAGGGVELNGRRVATPSSVAACRRALRRPCDGAMRWNIDDTVLKRFSIG